MTERRRTCEFCRASSPVNHTNGIIVNYQAEGKKDISVLLHKIMCGRLVEAIHPDNSDPNPARPLM
jgi:hypothetical protein